MLLRSSYIIISTFQSLDVQGRMVGLSECQEHFREGNHMLSWPVINEKRSHYFETEWLRILEQSMLLFKDALQLSLEPVACLTCALTTLTS